MVPSTSTGKTHSNTAVARITSHLSGSSSDFSADSIIDPEYQPQDDSTSDDNIPLSIFRERLPMQETKKPSRIKGFLKMKKEKQRLRNLGKAYKTFTAKSVPARQFNPLTLCRMKCKDRFHENDLKELFMEYWGLGSYSKRASYIASLMDIQEKATTRIRSRNPIGENRRTKTYKYFLIIRGKREPVCRECLLRTFNESSNCIKTVAKKKKSTIGGTNVEDLRGKCIPKRKISEQQREEIRKQISSFPAYESHYSRKQTEKKYLPSHLTKQKMYNLYKESTPCPVSIKIYSQEFKKLKLSFKQPRSDTCYSCDNFFMQIKLCADEALKNKIQQEHKTHQIQADLAYAQKRKDTEMAQNDPRTKTYCFDLQQCLPTPDLKSSVAFYKRQLWTFNLTIRDNETGVAYCYMWFETIAGRGANQIASCLYKHLTTQIPRNVERVIYYSDTCGGQNRNSHVAAMFTWFMQLGDCNIQIIDHKFMVPGHSHMEVDTDHGKIEKRKKKTEINIYHPHDWMQLVKSTGPKFRVIEMTQTDFLEFSSLLKGPLVSKKRSMEGNDFKWLETRWLRYNKQFGQILYKQNLDDATPFQSLELRRRGSQPPRIIPPICLTSLPISKEKKKDLIDLLLLIPDVFHHFYRNLPTSEDARNTDPDILESDEEVDF